MFENISFLFLCALAFLAWALLCFLHMVEIQRRSASDYRVELYTEHPAITFAPHQAPDLNSMPSGTYDFAMSFGVIFAMTFGLSKVLQLAEGHAKSYLKTRDELRPVLVARPISLNEEQNSLPKTVNERCPDPKSPDISPVDENAELKQQLQALQAHCLEMRELLQELRVSSSFSSHTNSNTIAITYDDDSLDPLVSEESDTQVWRRNDSIAEFISGSSQPFIEDMEPRVPNPSLSQSGQNIYITNSQIHINGGVFCTGNPVNVDLCRQASKYNCKPSEFLQVFDHFIKGPKERPMIAGIRCNSYLL
ncbi:uncharacterized protein Dana_GF10711 [Drosophila ananassae]|uniref:Uncharacterized protein n=1 Tax=Drosophila ananassae TaxID=7217 RepID=B3M6J1_DROAN|nr:uncharacterized protein LOC6493579 [Drosophila ananassae]EDV40840.2 uncharacterized protein Dana_GF10711 [Drosophila ananassae]